MLLVACMVAITGAQARTNSYCAYEPWYGGRDITCAASAAVVAPDSPGLLGYWRFDECPVAMAFDSSSAARHAYPGGGVNFVDLGILRSLFAGEPGPSARVP
jgi:hypothetical protein